VDSILHDPKIFILFSLIIGNSYTIVVDYYSVSTLGSQHIQNRHLECSVQDITVVWCE